MKKDITPNTKQRQCIDQKDGKIMVLAGPGTGKTFTIIRRIESLIQGGVEPNEILCLTFSDPAATEMKQRLVKEIGLCASSVNVYTYHAFCNDIIKEFPQRFELVDDVELIDETRKLAFIKEAIEEVNPKFYRTKFGDTSFFISEIDRKISAIKKDKLTKDDYFNAIETNPDWQPKLDALKIELKERELANNITKTLLNNIATTETKIGKAKELWAIFELFERKMFENNLIDFNDMITFVLDAFENDDDFKKEVANRYKYVLVDEYQDTNSAQNSIVFSLIDGSDYKNVFVVGDDDQIIFGFQGANMDNLETFLKRYPDTKVITLNENNRSTQTILDYSHKVIEENSTRLEVNPDFAQYEISKVLTAKNEKVIAKEKPINLYSFAQEIQEQNFIVDDIENLINSEDFPVDKDGNKKLNEIALLFRRHEDMIPYANLLKSKNIAYQMTQGKSIFEIQSSNVVYFYLKALQNNELYSDKLFSLLRFEPLAIDVEDYNFLITQNRLNHKDFITNIENNIDREWNDKAKINKFITTYRNLKKFAFCENLRNTIIKMINDTGILAYYHNQTTNKLENILALQKLIDEAGNLEKLGNGVYLGEYIAYLDNAFKNNIKIWINTDILPKNAVQLQTYHGSKGREFEYVYLPELTQQKWEKKKDKRTESLPTDDVVDDRAKKLKKRAEELKLLFVGITRAKHSLTLSFSNIVEGKSQMLSEYIASIPTDNINQQEFSIDEDEYNNLVVKMLTQEEPDYEKSFEVTLLAMIKEFQFSPSTLNCYLDCPKKFLYQNLLRIDIKETVNNTLNYGTTFHAALEDTAKIAKEKSAYPSLDEVVELFKSNLKKQEFDSQEAREQFEKRGVEKIKNYYARFVQTSVENIFELEYNFVGVEVDGIPLKGKIDRIEKNNDGTYSLYDYKTGSAKSASKIKDGEDYEHYLNQLRFYKLAFETQNPEAIVSQVGLLFVEEPEKCFYTNLTEEDNNIIKSKIKSAVESLNNLEFDRCQDKDSCKMCGYKQLCKVNSV